LESAKTSFVVAPLAVMQNRQEMSRSVNLDEDGALPAVLILPKIKEMSAEKVSPKKAPRLSSNPNQPPLLHSVAMTKQNGNTEKKFINFLQIIERNK
jgi:hypothetical protein